MINILVIGRMGTGKTTWIKTFLKGKRSYIFDVNNEYQGYNRMTNLEHKEFIKQSLTVRKTCLVFEDATGFVQGSLSGNFRKALVSKRHTGNVNICVYHSILSVPPRHLQLTDIVVLFKTNDEDYQVLSKFPSLYEHFLEVSETSNKHGFKTIKL